MERRHFDDLLHLHSQSSPVGATRRGILPSPPKRTLQYLKKHLHHSTMVTAKQTAALMTGSTIFIKRYQLRSSLKLALSVFVFEIEALGCTFILATYGTVIRQLFRHFHVIEYHQNVRPAVQ